MTEASASDEARARIWDVVVIGAGAGGATAGYAVARQGKSVLFLERGKLLVDDGSVVMGEPLSNSGDPEAAVRHGRWPRPLYRKNGHGDTAIVPKLGCGTGGSTALYSMVLERMRPEDFTPARFNGPSGASLPEAWPIAYDTLVPYYEEAERLFRVRGTQDPLAPGPCQLLDPPPASVMELGVTRALERGGLHPYRLHYACERVSGCAGCRMRLCPRACRNDAGRLCVLPAIREHGARVLPDCRVIRLEEEGRVVRRAICDWAGERIAIRARVFVLAANAFFTPALLQRSANDRFPDGLANSSGLVGRHLMMHVSDLLQLVFKHGLDDAAPMAHGLSVNDFFIRDGRKLGNLHAHADQSEDDAARTGDESSPYRSRVAFATIMEDLPYPTNFVRARSGSDEDIVFEYHHHPELLERSREFVHGIAAAVRADCEVRQRRPLGGLNMTHMCGTCRFGSDPRTSVLDGDNRAHDLDNLYIRRIVLSVERRDPSHLDDRRQQSAGRRAPRQAPVSAPPVGAPPKKRDD
jgi:choline dehydrogenase-like flavoprotein